MLFGCSFVRSFNTEGLVRRYRGLSSGRLDASAAILVVSTDKGIAEEHRIVGKRLVMELITELAQIEDSKDCCSASIPLGKRMNLPDASKEMHQPIDLLVRCQSQIIELSLLLEIILQRFGDNLVWRKDDRLAIEYPFAFRSETKINSR